MIKKDLSILKQDLYYLKCENKHLKDQSVKQETSSLRENQVFKGIKEAPTESEYLC